MSLSIDLLSFSSTNGGIHYLTDPRQHQWLSSLIQQFSCYGKYLRCKILCGNGLQCLLVQVSLDDNSMCGRWQKEKGKVELRHARGWRVCDARKKGPLVHPLHSHVPKFSISLFLLKPATQATMMITQVVKRNKRYNIFFQAHLWGY